MSLAQPMTLNRSMTLVEWALLFSLSVLWGGSSFFTGVAIREIPPVTLAALRVAGAALVLHAALRLSGAPFTLDRKVLLSFLGMGLLNNAIPFCLFMWWQSHIASALAVNRHPIGALTHF